MDNLSSNLSLHLNKSNTLLSNSKSIREKLLKSVINRESSCRSSSLPNKKFKYLTESHPTKSKPVIPLLKLSQLKPKPKPGPRAKSTLIKEKKHLQKAKIPKKENLLTRSKLIEQNLSKLVGVFTVKKVQKLGKLEENNQSSFELANALMKFMKPFDKTLAEINLKKNQEFFWEKFSDYIKQPGRITQNIRKLSQFIKEVELTRTEINLVKSHLKKSEISDFSDNEAAISVYLILRESLSLIEALNSECHEFKIKALPVVTRCKSVCKNKTVVQKTKEPKCIPVIFEPITIEEEKKPENVYADSGTDSSEEEAMDLTTDTYFPLTLCKNQLLKKFFMKEGNNFTQHQQIDLVQTFVPENKKKTEQKNMKIKSIEERSADCASVDENRLNKTEESICNPYYRKKSLEILHPKFSGLDQEIQLANELANREKKNPHKLLAKYKK